MIMFYAICSDYGFGVFSNMRKAKNGQQYLYNSSIMRFDDLSSAFNWAVTGYNAYQNGGRKADFFKGKFDDIGLDHILYKKSIRYKNSSRRAKQNGNHKTF